MTSDNRPMLLKACLNGARQPHEHPALPVSPDELAAAAAAAVHAGAGALHVHPKTPDGADTLEPEKVAQVLAAIRAAVPGMPVGITTGAWAESTADDRLEAVRNWNVLPDFASVNWHENGAVDLAELLLDRGVGVEAGLWSASDIAAWRTWQNKERCCRVLLEVVQDLEPDAAVEYARHLLSELAGSTNVPVLLHGEGSSCWPVFGEALAGGLDTRIGLEDTLTLPDCSAAKDNAELVATAIALINQS
jgi:uncharacterized protein (DUF849 family)